VTTELILPKFNMDMESAVLLKWLRAEGDRVQEGDPVAEVETDKVNMEVEATADGILFDLRYAEGDTVPVTAAIARIAPDEAAVAAARGSGSASGAEAAPIAEAAPVAARAGAPTDALAGGAESAQPGPGDAPGDAPGASDAGDNGGVVTALEAAAGGKVRATPAVRRLAREHGIDLARLVRNGERVTTAAVQAAVEGREQAPEVRPPAVASAPAPAQLAPPQAAASPTARVGAPSLATATSPVAPTGIPLDATRRAIAERMTKANEAPQITLNVEVRIGALSRLRQEATPRPSFSAIFAIAVARALRDHPNLNSTFEDGMIVTHAAVDLGIAVARPAGLIVPVLHDADRLTVAEADRKIRDLAARARDARLRLGDVSGGSFTITSLGEAGVDHFSPLLNPPQVGILGIGRIAPRVIAVDGGIRVEPTVVLSLTCDHRVIDGEPGAAFLATLRGLLESPGWLAGSMAAGETAGS